MTWAALFVPDIGLRLDSRLEPGINQTGADMANANNEGATQHASRYPAIHPAIVHFPIALFPLSAIFLILWFSGDNAFFLTAAYWTFMFAALGAVVTGGTGIWDYNNAPYPEHPEDGASGASKLHVRTGVLVTAIALIGGIFFLAKRPVDGSELVTWFAIIAFLETVLVMIQGFLGGRLVYRYHFGIEPRR